MNLTNETMLKISDLSDYPAIKKLAAALHQFNGNQHGTAIMIGAGFSRNAARHVSGEKKMPLWYEFSKKLMAELNPHDRDLSFSDPLRLAEEYRAYFGQAALNDRIRSEIDNDAWKPGELYKTLLKLPWSEVMTTNWDTLLERAAEDIDGPYYTSITKPSDFTWAPSPRIVKLHGTIGTSDTFIAAQEDYRTYPEKFAPFVNFARQVFIENELCLLGFSGDDPNFLHWAGWVRDHLAGHARKIYLVGALNLTAARRRHLESINIAPIDLWDAVKDINDSDLKHHKATELFLTALMEEGEAKVKPYEWKPNNLHCNPDTQEDHARKYKEPEYAATLLKGQLEALQKDRESYPGWLVCPSELRSQVQSQLSNPFPNADNISLLAPDVRAKLLYEIAWRHSITFEYIAPWLSDLLFQVANPDEPLAISKHQQMEIALILLKNSRWLETNNDEGKQINQEYITSLITILEKHALYLPDCCAELSYHQALVARDELDYISMEVLIEKIVGEDPVWKLRQAALLMELGRFEEGAQLIAKSYGELRANYRRDRHSISILSRLLWAHWLLEAIHRSNFNQVSDELPSFAEIMYRKWKCDPWTWFENIQEKVRKQQEDYLKNKNPIEPSFDQGHYRNNSNQNSFNNEIFEFFLLDGITRSVGIPLRLGNAFLNVNLLAGAAEKLVISGGIGIEMWDYTLAIRAASDESSSSIKNVFTRMGVACSSKGVVDILVNRILIAIDYRCKQRSKGDKEQQSHALSALRVLIEVLARLVVRVSPEKAKEIFRLAKLMQQRDFQHPWLFDVFKHLLTRSLESIPKSEQGDLLAEALAFPLQSEMMSTDFPNCPNPVINHANARETYPGIETRISELIEAVKAMGSASSTAALLRLLPLVKKEGFLTQAEHEKLASNLWGNPPLYKVLPNTGLNPHGLLLLPAPDAEQVKALVRCHLYEHKQEVLADTQRAIMICAGIANAAANEMVRMFPTPEQALALFDSMVAWRLPIEKDDFLGAANIIRKQLIESISNALSYAIVPALSNEAKTVERFEQLNTFYKEVEGAFVVIPAFVYFAPINENIAVTVEKTIRKSLQGCDAREVIYAAIALQKWMEHSEPANSIQLSRLISRLIVIIESGRTVGLQQLILIAGELFKKQLLSEEQVATLIEAIANAFKAAEYTNIGPNSQEAINASSIREACAKVANTLIGEYPNDLALQDLLKESKMDALPEVRFATLPPP